MIISSSFYLFFHWHCFNVSLFRQCSIIVLCCSIPRCFHRSGGVPLLWSCSVIRALFHHSVGVPCSGFPVVSHCSVFRCCSVVKRVFHVPVFQWCSIVPRVFCVPCSGVPGFIVCQSDSEVMTLYKCHHSIHHF